MADRRVGSLLVVDGGSTVTLRGVQANLSSIDSTESAKPSVMICFGEAFSATDSKGMSLLAA